MKVIGKMPIILTGSNHTDAMMILNALFDKTGATNMQRAKGIWRPNKNGIKGESAFNSPF